MISVLSRTNGYAAGQLLGLFHDKQAAIAAITAPSSTGDTNGNERATKAA